MRPVLVYLPFHIPIYSYGVMLAISFMVGASLTLRLCERDGLDRQLMGRCYFWTAVSAVVGARLLYVLTNLERIDSVIDILKVNQGGLVAYGGFLGGFFGSLVFCRRHGVRLLAWADCAVPSLCTGLMITRIGCLLYGCDFGKVWDGPLAIHFPPGSPAFNQHRMEGWLGPDATRSLGVHPTQLYESLNGLILLCVVMLARRYRKFSGESFVAFTMGYAVLRYIVETLRADEQRGSVGPLSTSQFIGVMTFAAGGLLLVWLMDRYRRNPGAMRLWENGLAMAAAGAAAEPETPREGRNAAKRRRRRK